MQKQLNQHGAMSMMFNIIALLSLLSVSNVLRAEEVVVNALPTGGQVVAGNANIVADHSNAAAPVLNINQTSQRAVVNWDKFDVGSAATVNFNQPNAQASTLNKITSGSPSKIMGKINAPGTVILVNQQGVYFTPTATLDVGSVVATSHDISNADYMDGKHTYDRNGATGKVVNEGNIQTAVGGYVALLAPEVRNSGVIVARMGTVVLAAGERITLNFDPSRHLASISTTPSQINTLVENKLAVQAPGGLIILSARAVNNLTAGVIKQSGTLSASADGITNVGGRIMLTANTVKLEANSQTLARGNLGGGEVKIVASQTAIVEPTAKVSVSAIETGHAGNIDIHADEKTTIQGTLLAQGGKQSGNGGVINTTSHGQVEIANTAVVKAGVRGSVGEVGTWNIVAGGFKVNTNNAGVVSNAINQNNVTIKVSATSCAALGNCNLLTAAGLNAGQLVVAQDAVIQKTSPRLTTLSLQATHSDINSNSNSSNNEISQIIVDGKILGSEPSPFEIKVLSDYLVEIRQNAELKASKIEAISKNGFYNGSLWSYFNHSNTLPLPIISLLARTLAITGSVKSGSQNRAGSIKIAAENSINIENATIFANGNEGGVVELVSMNGTVNLTNTVVQTNGGEGRGGAISLAGLQNVALNNATLEATGATQGGQVSLISNVGDINFLNSIIQTNGGSGLGGTISFDASRALASNGQLRANSQSAKAGLITLEAKHILLDTQANLQATGATGGGNILVGGDWQGGANIQRRVFADPNALRQAITVTMNQGAIIDASATQNGNGGTVVLWSDIKNTSSVTDVQGSIVAKGGVLSGNGGQVETSGRLLNIGDAISVSTKASKGLDGEWLLDPEHLWIVTPDWTGFNYSIAGITTYTARTANPLAPVIESGAYTQDRGPTVDGVFYSGVTTLKVSTIVTALSSGNVRVLATGLIDVYGWQGSNISNYYINSTTANRLTLEAGTTLVLRGGL